MRNPEFVLRKFSVQRDTLCGLMITKVVITEFTHLRAENDFGKCYIVP